MADRGHLFIPILIVFVGLVMGYSAPLCALIATLACLPVAMLRRTTRAGITWRTAFDALEDGAKNTLSVAIACACAGVIIGATTITGMGIVFTQVVLELSHNSLVLALALTALAGIVLGMGLPTTPSYILMVALLVPAVVKLGVVTPAAHMFAFYFAILSAITPPVALAVFAAASLAKADMWDSGWAAMRIGAAGYIVPFMFVYEPERDDDRALARLAVRVRQCGDRCHGARRQPARVSACGAQAVAARRAVCRSAAPDRARADQLACRHRAAMRHRRLAACQPGQRPGRSGFRAVVADLDLISLRMNPGRTAHESSSFLNACAEVNSPDFFPSRVQYDFARALWI